MAQLSPVNLLVSAVVCASVCFFADPASGSGPGPVWQRGGATPRSVPARPSTPLGVTPPRDTERPRGQTAPRSSAIGGVSEVSARGSYPAENEQRVWFSTADHDRSGWISFREASATMRFDAARFRIFDTDKDGRFTYEEFSQFIVTEATRGRRLVEPVPPPKEGGPRRRSAEQLRAAFDEDLDGAISRFEFDAILREYREEAEAFDSEDVFVRLDMDDNKTLDVSELGRLASFLTPPVVGGKGVRRGPLPGANTILDLFGEAVDAGDSHPPTIAGPVPPFRRLDLNNDGFVDIDDLERLEGRSFNSVRLGSVLNTLDIDDDGRLSEAEFLRSMTPRKGR